MPAASPFPFTASSAQSERIPNPFLDVPGLMMPGAMNNALDLCEFIWNKMGVYRGAMQRVAGFLLTDLLVDGVDHDEREKQLEFFRDQLSVLARSMEAFENFLCYGNNFTSVIVPFTRFLQCPGCSREVSLNVATDPRWKDRFAFRFTNFSFHLNCPSCQFSGAWDYDDRPVDEETSLIVKNWNPKEIDIKHDFYTGKNIYYWRIPDEYKRLLRLGDFQTISQAPRGVLEAVKSNWLYRFNENEIYHMAEPTLAGMQMRGWGLSKTLVNFGLVYHVQTLHKFNETLALDYVVPTRIITPAIRQGSGAAGGLTSDPALMGNMADFSYHVQRMLRQRHRYPDKIHVLPYPIQYGTLSGDARQFAPSEMISQGLESLFMAINVPAQLFSADLSAQAAPMALRLFQSTWAHALRAINGWLDWLGKQVSRLLLWDQTRLRLAPNTIVDNADRTLLLMQLMTGNVISQTTGLRGLNLDFLQETRMKGEEQKIVAESQKRVEEEMQTSQVGQAISQGMSPAALGLGLSPEQQAQQQAQQQAGGAPAGPTAGPAAGPAVGGPVDVQSLLQMVPVPGQPITPEDMQAAAADMAGQLVLLDPGTRRQVLKTVRESNEAFHKQLTGAMAQTRSDARSQGQQIVLQQAGGVG